ncbi:hypothetical protein Tco_0642358 [Tanacetum coccineum]
MLQFLSICCISTALTKQPSAYYLEYLKEFWYSVETIRAGLETLRLFDEKNPDLLSTDLVNLSLLRIRYFSPIWRVLMLHVVKCLGGMHGSHDQININQQVIAYSLCWGLNADIDNILFFDLVATLVNGKKGREQNVCYTRFLSHIEHLLGDAYKNDKLKLLNPITSRPLLSRIPLQMRLL